MQLGDLIHDALELVGIDSDRVSRWLGTPCNCSERIEKLNALSRWATRVIKGKTQTASKYLWNLLDDDDT